MNQSSTKQGLKTQAEVSFRSLCEDSEEDEVLKIKDLLLEHLKEMRKECRRWEQLSKEYESMETDSKKKCDAVLRSADEGKYALHGLRTSSYTCPPEFKLDPEEILNDVQKIVGDVNTNVKRIVTKRQKRMEIAEPINYEYERALMKPNMSLADWLSTINSQKETADNNNKQSTNTSREKHKISDNKHHSS